MMPRLSSLLELAGGIALVYRYNILMMPYSDGCFLQVQPFEARTTTSELPLHGPRCDRANVCDYVSVAYISNDAEAIQPPGLSWCDYTGSEFGNFANSGPDQRVTSPVTPAEVGTNWRNVLDDLQQADKGLLQMRMALSVILGLLGTRCRAIRAGICNCEEPCW